MESLTAKRIIEILLLGALAASLPLILPLAYLPGFTRTVVMAAAAMTLNILIGNTGLLSLSQGLFIGIGAYAVALGNLRFGLSTFPAMAIGFLVSLVLGAVVAAIALRARHLFFGLLTLAIGQVGYVLVTTNYQWTGGDDGLVGFLLPSWLRGDVAQHLFAVTVATIIVLLIQFILSSPFGMAMRSVRDNPERVASLGVNPKLVEFVAMMIAGCLAAICGSVLAITDETVGPSTLSWVLSANLLVMVALGGRSMFYGPIIGVTILESLRNYVQGYSEHSDLVVGLIIICCALAFPEGIALKLTDYARNRRRRDDEMRHPSATRSTP